MIERMLVEAEQADAAEPGLYGPIPTDKLPKDLVDAEQRRERLVKALAAAKARDESPKAKAQARKGKKVKPAAVPIADPESAVLPNKEGGFAPNFTPLATTESQGGFIADAEVLPGGEDPQQAVETVDRIDEAFGQKPDQMLADGAYDSRVMDHCAAEITAKHQAQCRDHRRVEGSLEDWVRNESGGWITGGVLSVLSRTGRHVSLRRGHGVAGSVGRSLGGHRGQRASGSGKAPG